MPGFEVIKRQPDFPNEDLSRDNTVLMEFYLREMRQADAYARFLGESMRALHLTAHFALELTGVKVKYTPEEYEAFCKGFAAVEYMANIVNPRYELDQIYAKNAQELLTGEYIIPELEVATRREAWVDMYPNINGVVLNVGVAQGETTPQLHSRAIGAQLASELRMAA